MLKVGLDLSLTSTGVFLSRGQEYTTFIISSDKTQSTVRRIWYLAEEIAEILLDFSWGEDIFISVEAPTLHQQWSAGLYGLFHGVLNTIFCVFKGSGATLHLLSLSPATVKSIARALFNSHFDGNIKKPSKKEMVQMFKAIYQYDAVDKVGHDIADACLIGEIGSRFFASHNNYTFQEFSCFHEPLVRREKEAFFHKKKGLIAKQFYEVIYT